MLLHPLTNFETQSYYQNEPRFNGVFSRKNLPKHVPGAEHVPEEIKQIVGNKNIKANIFWDLLILF